MNADVKRGRRSIIAIMSTELLTDPVWQNSGENHQDRGFNPPSAENVAALKQHGPVSLPLQAARQT